jgi:uncharacterized protein YuzE
MEIVQHLVSLSLQSLGYFVLEGTTAGLREADILAISLNPDGSIRERIHCEVHVSTNPAGVLRPTSRFGKSASFPIERGGDHAMRFTYDPRYNIAYIRFQGKRAEVETIRISDELVVDMAPDGTIYGIEMLNANEQLRREDTGRLLVINEATGERAELLLAVS